MNNNKGITLYDHQNEMVAAADKVAKGVFVAPTGSGKTLAQAEIVAKEIDKGGFRIICVKTPRITLTNQINIEYTSYLFGREYDSIILHSGRSDEAPQDFASENPIELARFFKSFKEATSDMIKVANLIEAARKDNIPFIIYTTYHSNEKAWNIVSSLNEEIALDINDEGHFLTQACFNENFDLYEPKRQYSFTATLRVTDSDEGRGMNNVDRFGDIAYSMPIREAIDKNLILPIKPHYIKTESDTDRLSELKAIGEFVRTSFEHLEENTLLTPKMLVATQGASQIEDFINSNTCADLIEEGVNIITVHSNKECTTVNGKVVSRKEFNDAKNKLGKDDDAKLIVMHYDILSEGIDIPGLTGVVILRNMEMAKFLQTVGRVIRLYRKNPKLKTHGMLYFPDLSDKDLVARFDGMLLNMWQEGFIPEEVMNELLAAGSEEEEEEEVWSGSDQSSRERRLELFIENGFKMEDFFGDLF